MRKDHYEDADWHPLTSFTETLTDLTPDAPLVIRNDNTGAEDSTNQTFNQTVSNSSASECGEFSSQLMSNGQCRLTATLPPVGNSQKRCPDMFRCTDDVSYWLHENENRKEQLEELKETMSGLQEELRNHRHRVKALEMQVDFLLSTPRRHAAPRARGAAVRAAGAAPKPVGNRAPHESQHGLQGQRDQDCATARHARHTAARCTSSKLHFNFVRLPSDVQPLSFCPSDCASLYHNGVRRSGVYTIVLSPGTARPVYCDMETEGGGWTVLQRRRDGSVSFNRGWSEYRDGFGEPRGEHWLGNQHLHRLSNQGHYSLRIDLQDWSHAHKHALYHTFRIEDEDNQYRLHVSGFSGTAEDSFGWYHDLQGFSTPDTGNICAEISHAGWWFHQCFYANLNGVYYKVTQNLLGPDGIVWFSWKDSDFYSLKAVTMMARPHNFRPRLSP
uniref:Angiopoietin-related protein 7-like n=1 Tax=Pundamilia nyererei TaxID=303518 RepID=A0A3B4HC76_9CICH